MTAALGKSLFLSCSEQDASAALRMEAFFTREGFDVWLYKHGQCLGRRFLETVYEAMGRADALVFLLSTHSIDSEWCLDEASQARTIKKQVIVPVVLDGCSFSDSRIWRLLTQWGGLTAGRELTEEEMASLAVSLAQDIDADRSAQALRRSTDTSAVQVRVDPIPEFVRLPITERWSVSGASVLVKVDRRAPGAGAVRVWLERDCSKNAYGTGSWRFARGEYEDRVRPTLLRLLG